MQGMKALTKAREGDEMNKLLALLAVAAIMAVVFISGCTQQPEGPGPATGEQIAAENSAVSAIEQEMEQAVNNISTEDIENALLNL